METDENNDNYSSQKNRLQLNKKKFGEGSFGEVYLGKINDKKFVAVKKEIKKDDENSKNRSCLENEYLHMKELSLDRSGGIIGFPRVFYFKQKPKYNYLVMDILNKNLEELKKYNGGRLSYKTISMFAIQALQRLEYIHTKNRIHCDIKPTNFMIGHKEQKSIIYLIDFGLCRKEKPDDSNRRRKSKGVFGTLSYMSPFVHVGLIPSRRDDLFSLFFVLVYLFKGKLPWQRLNIPDGEKKVEEVYRLKKENLPFKICDSCPGFFYYWVDYISQLKPDSKISYEYLYLCVVRDLVINKSSYDLKFDWMV